MPRLAGHGSSSDRTDDRFVPWTAERTAQQRVKPQNTRSRANGSGVLQQKYGATARAESALPPAQGRQVLAIVIVVSVALAFAGLSMVLSALQATQYLVSATVLTQPDPSLIGTTTAPLPDASDRFVQSQIVAMQSLAQNGVPGQQRTARADITVTQVGLTDILQITASASVPADAVTSANLLLDSYVRARQQNLAQHAKAAADEVNRQLRNVTRGLQASESSLSAADANAQNAGRTAEYSRLLSLRNQIRLTAASAESINVVSRAEARDVTTASNKVRNALLAGLLGALAATGILIGRRRFTIGQLPAGGSLTDNSSRKK